MQCEHTGTTASSCPRGEVQSVKACQLFGTRVSRCAALQGKEEGRQPGGRDRVTAGAGEDRALCIGNRLRREKGRENAWAKTETVTASSLPS